MDDFELKLVIAEAEDQAAAYRSRAGLLKREQMRRKAVASGLTKADVYVPASTTGSWLDDYIPAAKAAGKKYIRCGQAVLRVDDVVDSEEFFYVDLP